MMRRVAVELRNAADPRNQTAPFDPTYWQQLARELDSSAIELEFAPEALVPHESATATERSDPSGEPEVDLTPIVAEEGGWIASVRVTTGDTTVPGSFEIMSNDRSPDRYATEEIARQAAFNFSNTGNWDYFFPPDQQGEIGHATRDKED